MPAGRERTEGHCNIRMSAESAGMPSGPLSEGPAREFDYRHGAGHGLF